MRSIQSRILHATLTALAALSFAACGQGLEAEGAEADAELGTSESAITSTTLTSGPVAGVVQAGAGVYFTSPFSNGSSTCPSGVRLKRYDVSTAAVTTYRTFCGGWSTGIATDGSSVFFGIENSTTSSGYLMRLGSDGTIVTLTSGLPRMHRMAVDASNVFIATDVGLYRAPKTGGAATRLSTQRAYDVVIDDANAFLCNEQGVVRLPKAGGAAVSLHNRRAERLAQSATDIYWMGGDNITLGRVPKAGGANTVLLTMGTWNLMAAELALRGSNLVFIIANDVGGGASLHRLPAAGGTASVLLRNLSGPFGLAPVASRRPPGAIDSGLMYVGDYSALRRVTTVDEPVIGL